MDDIAACLREVTELGPELRANGHRADRESRFPTENLASLRTTSLMGVLVPREYGGPGGSLRNVVTLAQELASHCLSTAFIWGMHVQQVDSLSRFAAPALASRILPLVSQGSSYIASITTEPETPGVFTAHSPLERLAEGFDVDRTAPIVTGADHADAFLITFRQSVEDPPERVTLLYAERSQLTVERTRPWVALGMRSTESIGVRIRGCVPAAQVVGQEGEFRTIAIESMVPVGHIAWAACWIGAAREGLRRVVSVIREDGRRGRHLPDLAAARLARVRMDLELSQAYLARMADKLDALRAEGASLNRPGTQIQLNLLKVASSEAAFRAIDEIIDVVGMDRGYREDSELELPRLWRDLRSARLNHSNDRLLAKSGHLSIIDPRVSLLGDDPYAPA